MLGGRQEIVYNREREGRARKKERESAHESSFDAAILLFHKSIDTHVSLSLKRKREESRRSGSGVRREKIDQFTSSSSSIFININPSIAS